MSCEETLFCVIIKAITIIKTAVFPLAIENAFPVVAQAATKY